jgi:ABC-type transport system involved in multi-copper enzyme maturation permease subunit
MKALLWKDLYCARMILLLGLVLMAIPYLVVFAGGFFDNIWWSEEMVWIAAHFSVILSLIVIPLLAGNAFAGERADQTAEFLASLPISRLLIVISKLLLALGAGLVIWLVNISVIRYLEQVEGGTSNETILIILTVMFIMFGAAWLCSSFSSDPPVATGIGLAAPILIGCIVYAAGTLLQIEIFKTWTGSFKVVGSIFAVLCFVAGTVYFLRRFEP